jgi:hypothetical protein
LKQHTENIKRFGTCSKDCYGSCVFVGEWNDQAPEKKLLNVNPLKNHPFTNGFLCPKFNHREELLYHPHRLKSALIICTNATRDDKSRLFKIKVIVKAKSIIANKIRKIMLLCGDLKS